MIWLILVSCITGMIMPAIVFPFISSYLSRWATFFVTTIVGIGLAFIMSYAFYLQFIR